MTFELRFEEVKFHQVNKEGKRKVIPGRGTASVKAWECEPAEGLWELSMVCGEGGVKG